MPNLFTSAFEAAGLTGVDVFVGGAESVIGVGLIGSGFFNSTSSAPHFSIRSASSFAAFSASSKDIGSAIFFVANF